MRPPSGTGACRIHHHCVVLMRPLIPGRMQVRHVPPGQAPAIGDAMTWAVGRVAIARVIELETVGGSRFILPQATREEVGRLGWLHPRFADADGRLKMSIHSYVVETPSRRIVVDTGLGNDKQGRAIPTWNDRNGPYLETMTAAGFSPDSIDTV